MLLALPTLNVRTPPPGMESPLIRGRVKPSVDLTSTGRGWRRVRKCIWLKCFMTGNYSFTKIRLRPSGPGKLRFIYSLVHLLGILLYCISTVSRETSEVRTSGAWSFSSIWWIQTIFILITYRYCSRRASANNQLMEVPCRLFWPVRLSGSAIKNRIQSGCTLLMNL